MARIQVRGFQLSQSRIFVYLFAACRRRATDPGARRLEGPLDLLVPDPARDRAGGARDRAGGSIPRVKCLKLSE